MKICEEDKRKQKEECDRFYLKKVVERVEETVFQQSNQWVEKSIKL